MVWVERIEDFAFTGDGGVDLAIRRSVTKVQPGQYHLREQMGSGGSLRLSISHPLTRMVLTPDLVRIRLIRAPGSSNPAESHSTRAAQTAKSPAGNHLT